MVMMAYEQNSDDPSGEGDYTFSVTINVAMMGLPDVAEDGIVVSDAMLGKFNCKTYDKRTVEFGQNALPLNLYPDEPPSPGFKITDIFGAMGPVCTIHPDDKEQ